MLQIDTFWTNVETVQVSRLAIGVEGGFDLDTKKFEYEDRNSVVLLPGFQQFKIGNLR